MTSNMTPVDWAKRPIVEKYADFSGRAPRAEYWWYGLALIVAFILAMIVESMLGLNRMVLGLYGPLTVLFGLALIVPNLSVTVRRLHDTDRSGWWILLWLVPWVLSIVGATLGMGVFATSMAGLVMLVCCIVLLVFMVLPSTPGDNRYGPNPYGEGDGERVAAE